MNEHPEIMALNSKFTRNEGLSKSMKEDQIVDISNQ